MHRYTHSLPRVRQSSASTRRANATSPKVSLSHTYTQLLNVSFVVVLATQTILSKIPPNNSKLTYVWEQYLFHYISEGGFTYLVMADDAAGRCVSKSLCGVGDHSPYLRNVQENAFHVPRRTPAQGTSFHFSAFFMRSPLRSFWPAPRRRLLPPLCLPTPCSRPLARSYRNWCTRTTHPLRRMIFPARNRSLPR